MTGVVINDRFWGKANHSLQNFFEQVKYVSLKWIHFFAIQNATNVIDIRDAAQLHDRQMRTENVLKLYGNSIVRIGYSYFKNMSDAEDILQDTLIQYLRKAPIFENEDHEKAWLLRVAINTCKNQLKYNKRRMSMELDEGLIAEENNEFMFVWDAVNDLSVKYREVVHLFYHEGYSTAQIGELLDKKEPTVRSLLYRARKILKGILGEEYDFEE
jgi:RNA polymerase sigma-70 factor (ECF subfamily)